MSEQLEQRPLPKEEFDALQRLAKECVAAQRVKAPSEGTPTPERTSENKISEILNRLKSGLSDKLTSEAMFLLLETEIHGLENKLLAAKNTIQEFEKKYHRNGDDGSSLFDIVDTDGKITLGLRAFDGSAIERAGYTILRQFDANGFVVYEAPSSEYIINRFIEEPPVSTEQLKLQEKALAMFAKENGLMTPPVNYAMTKFEPADPSELSEADRALGSNFVDEDRKRNQEFLDSICRHPIIKTDCDKTPDFETISRKLAAEEKEFLPPVDNSKVIDEFADALAKREDKQEKKHRGRPRKAKKPKKEKK